MSCCQTASLNDQPARINARAQACIACPHGAQVGTGPLAGQTTTCRALATPKPVTLRIRSGVCPADRFPDQNGHVRWIGLTWIGLPMPLRIRARLTSPTPIGPIDGCGCIAILKDFWEKVYALAAHVPGGHRR